MKPARLVFPSLCPALLVLLAAANAWAQPGESEIDERERAGDAAVVETPQVHTSPPEAPYIRRRQETDFGALVIDPDFRISKVHAFLNDRAQAVTNNKPMDFERKYWSWGGITNEEKEMREGHYYVVSWSSKRPDAGDYVARFEYRQRETKEQVKRLEIPHYQVKGTVRSTFAVLGKAYKQNGEVIAWRFTLWDGDELVAQETSFVW
ncbi:MAG: hypothetical protein AAGK14_05595 [Verrucomicrobiota bacterium]